MGSKSRCAAASEAHSFLANKKNGALFALLSYTLYVRDIFYLEGGS